jgi:hypothetical protein
MPPLLFVLRLPVELCLIYSINQIAEEWANQMKVRELWDEWTI